MNKSIPLPLPRRSCHPPSARKRARASNNSAPLKTTKLPAAANFIVVAVKLDTATGTEN